MERDRPAKPGQDDGAPWWAWPLSLTDRACCCPARPLVVAVLPPTAARPYPEELLLCGHHYRTSIGALIAAGAAVYDESGTVIPAEWAAAQTGVA